MMEEQIKRVKKLLESWHIVLLPLKSVLLWEQQWHPYAILLTISILFFSIYLIDLSTIVTFAIFGLIINFIDLIVNTVCKTIYSPDLYKEKMFEDLCRDIVTSYNGFVNRIYSFYSLRETCPSKYYVISTTLLLTTAWLASSMNNILLLYLLSIVVLLWPGIQHRVYFKNILYNNDFKGQPKNIGYPKPKLVNCIM